MIGKQIKIVIMKEITGLVLVIILFGTPQEFFIRYISRNEYSAPASPECIFTEFHKLNEAAKDDIDKLEPISDFPNYVEDFMSYIIMGV